MAPHKKPVKKAAKKTAKRTSKSKAPGLSYRGIPLKDLVKLLPGFDPYREASGYHFDEAAAHRAIEFFLAFLTHTRGPLARKPYELEPHEAALVANIFGWKDAKGNRRFWEIYYSVARKNSKTTLVAGIAIMIQAVDQEVGKEIYCSAADEEQARILYETAVKMVNNDEDLDAMATTMRQGIDFPATLSSIKAITKTPKTKHGKAPYANFFDEVHVMEEELIDVMTTGQADQAQPLNFFTTTAGVIDASSVCYDIYLKAVAVRDGQLDDPHFLPAIYEAPQGCAVDDPAAWLAANPNLGKSVKEDYLASRAAKAKNNPAYENTFRRLHLNQWTEVDERWLSMEHWNLCPPRWEGPPIEWRNRALEDLAGKRAAAGLDLGSVSDLTALALLFEVDRRTIILPWFWAPEDGSWKKTKYRAEYERWAEWGFLTLTPGNRTDYDQVKWEIAESDDSLVSRFGIREFGVDAAWQGEYLCQQLSNFGLKMFPIPQTWKFMTSPCRDFEARVLDHSIDHGNNPILRWMAGNVAIQHDATGAFMRPVKPLKGRELKIDGIVAALMALHRLVTFDPNEGMGSHWDNLQLDHDGNPLGVVL